MAVDPVGVVKCVGNAVAGPAIDASTKWIGYVQTCETNVKEVQKLHKNLKSVQTEVKKKVEIGDLKNEEMVPEVGDWLKDVHTFLKEDDDWKDLLLDDEARRKAERCCFGCCWSPFYRHGLSKRAEEKSGAIDKMIKTIKDRGDAPLTLPSRPLKFASTSGNFCQGLKSREDKIDEILDVLRNDDANRIGIYGMGGAGKTTIAYELARRAENEKLFDAVFVVEISQFPDYKRIQDQITHRIGYNLDRYCDNIEERARYLGDRLVKIKRGKRGDDDQRHGQNKEEKLGDETDGKPRNLNHQDDPSETKNFNKQVSKNFKKLKTIKENKLETIDGRCQNKDKVEGQEEQIDNDDEKEGRVKGKKLGDDEKQGRAEKSGKLLVVLDNIWKKLDLHLVGIPYELQKDPGCKIIVISRSKDVCKSMDATESQIFEVGDLNEDEVERLFRERIGNKIIDSNGYKQIFERILGKCSRLPLSINVLADTLKNQTLSVWERIIKQMEKPTQGEAFGVLGDTYSIIEMSYNYLGNKEKKMFFLLCCLFPPGSVVRFNDLLRYGIGLGLFQYVNSICEAIDQAHKWADDLKSLSLLSKVNVNRGEISIHDDVREAGKAFAAKGEYIFHVGAIPKWLKRDSYKRYSIVSMTSDDSYKYLAGRDLPKLQLLRCLGASCANLHENYFIGMSNLKVLDLSRSIIEAFPLSMEHLQNLETLLLEYCSLKDISLISNLVNLQALSLKESNITRLPKEMRGLMELKLLDLSNCDKLHHIPAGIFVNLLQLEGLYMKGSFSKWTTSGEMASLTEFKFLPLHVLEITIQSIEQLFDKDFPILDLSSYKIDLKISPPENSSPRDLQIGGVHALDLVKEGWKPLMKRAESLYLENIKDLKNIAPYLDEYGFRELKRVKVSECYGMECFISRTAVYRSMVFPKLEVLCLECMPDLVTINHGISSPTLFSDLQQLTLSHLGLKSFAITIQQANRLRSLEVKSCDNLEFIFYPYGNTQFRRGREAKGNHEIQLPCLEKLILDSLNTLRGLIAVETDTNDDNQSHPLFRKIIFPSLDKMKLIGLPKIDTLWYMTNGDEFIQTFPKLRSIFLEDLVLNHVWSSEFYKGRFSFPKVKKLKINNCGSLKTVCPISVARGLDQLELLRIYSCSDLEQVISTEDSGQDSTSSKKSTGVSFLNLLTLDFVGLNNLTHFYKGSMKMEFHVLKCMKLDTLPKLETFLIKVEKSKKKQRVEELPKDCILFHEEIKFLSLEELYVESLDSIKSLWDVRAQKFSTVFPKLRRVSLNYMDELKYVWNKELTGPSTNFINLQEIEISSCNSLESLFPPSAVNDTFINMRFSELQSFKVESSNAYKYFLQGNVDLEFPVLNKLELNGLDKLKTFAKLQYFETLKGGVMDNKDEDDPLMPLFNKMILFPSLEELQLQNLCNVQKLWGMTNSEEFNLTFLSLQTLTIANIPKLRYVWNDELKEESQFFGTLENIAISGCGELKSLFSFTTSDFPPRSLSIKLISFPKLQRLILSDLDSFECVLHRNSQMEFQALKELTVRFLPLVKILVKLEKWDSQMRLDTDVEEASEKKEESANKVDGESDKEGSGLEANPDLEPDEKGFSLEKPDEEGSGPAAEPNGEPDAHGSGLEREPNGEPDKEGSSLEAKPKVKPDEEGSSLDAKPNGKPDKEDSGPEAESHGEPDAQGSSLEADPNGEADEEVSCHEAEPNTVEGSFGVDAVLFRGNVEFSSLEVLRVKYMDELENIYETEVNDATSSSVFPKLRTLHLTGGSDIKLKHLPEGLLHKLSSLFVRKFNTFKCLVSSANVSAEAALIRSLSELNKLENLTIKDCNSIENLFEAEGDQDMTSLPNLRILELSRLARLKQIQWHVLPNLQSLNLEGCLLDQEFLIQAPSVAQGLWLQQLEKMTIKGCERMEAIVGRSTAIQNDGEIVFPQLKEIVLWRMFSLCTFSSASCTTIRLPSLVSVDFYRCGLLRSFSPSSVVTPKLSQLEIEMELFATDEDLNSILQRQCEKNNMAVKCWPQNLKHKLHEEHELKLIKYIGYNCDGCRKYGGTYSYTCAICRFDLHPICAFDESQLLEEPDEFKVGKDWPRTLKHVLHDSHELKLVMGRIYRCNGCSQSGNELYAYYCEECDFDLHPKCALPDISESAST